MKSPFKMLFLMSLYIFVALLLYSESSLFTLLKGKKEILELCDRSFVLSTDNRRNTKNLLVLFFRNLLRPSQ